MVQIKLDKARINQKQTPLLVIGIFENEQEFLQSQELDSTIIDTIKELIENKEFKANFGSTFVLPTMGRGPMKKILLVGLGKKDKFSYEVARNVAGKACQKIKELGIAEFSIYPFSDLDEGLVEAICEGIYLSTYSFNKYKSNNKTDKFVLKEVRIVSSSDLSKFNAASERAALVSEAVNFARDLSNLPPNDCAPSNLASVCASLAAEYGMNLRVIERYQMESLGMGGIVAVGKGSNNPPKLIILEYKGAADDQKPYVLVGKAVTFDTGGISLKPADKMDEMKYDKCGGCAVIASMKAIASLKLGLNAVGIIPSVENMPSSTSYRPGDIIKMYNGKTVEVLNTDAEGRMILADALSYGIATYNPKIIIDLATLTGACIIALGANIAAMVGTNKQLIDKLKDASEKSGEKIWELPLQEEFHEQIMSHVADIKNIGGRPGGAITASAFLSNFTDGTPWAHLDIAGTAWTQDGTFEKSYNPKGATGFGVRLLAKFLFEESINSGNNSKV